MVESLFAFGFAVICIVVGKLVNRFDPHHRTERLMKERPWTGDEWNKYPLTNPTVH